MFCFANKKVAKFLGLALFFILIPGVLRCVTVHIEPNVDYGDLQCVSLGDNDARRYTMLINSFLKSINYLTATCEFVGSDNRVYICNFELRNTDINSLFVNIVERNELFTMTLQDTVMIYAYLDKTGAKKVSKSLSLASIWTKMLSGSYEYDDIIDVYKSGYKCLSNISVKDKLLGAVVKKGSYKVVVVFSRYGNGNLKDIVGWIVYHNNLVDTICILSNVKIRLHGA